MSLTDAALAHAYRGWPVFPCRPRGKEPLIAGGFKAATTDEAQVRAWWTRWPEANVGYRTGGLVVVEIDPPEGVESMNALRKTRAWPPTLTAMSGGLGLHFFFRPPSCTLGECPRALSGGARGVCLRSAQGLPLALPCSPVRGAPQDGKGRSLGLGISVRATGQYVILPPSVHPSGRRYSWVNRVEPASMPAWMIERLRPTPPPLRPIEPPRGDLTRYAAAALDAELQAVDTAPEGTLNDTLNRAAYSLGRLVPTISESTIADTLLAAALRNGHPERGAWATIRSGLTAGMARR